MYYVYVLKSEKNGSFYIGFTSNWEKRLKEHNQGKNKATRPFRPYNLIFYESFLNTKDAKAREEYLKSGWGWRSLKKILKNYLSG